MTCCGQKQNRAGSRRLNRSSERRMVQVEYIGSRQITLFSSATMRSYTFSPSPNQRVQRVYPVDADMLVRRAQFRRTS